MRKQMRNPIREVIGGNVIICEAFPRRRGWEVLCSFTKSGRQSVIASHGTWGSKEAAFQVMSELLDSFREKYGANPGLWSVGSYQRDRVRRVYRVSKMGVYRRVIIDT